MSVCCYEFQKVQRQAIGLDLHAWFLVRDKSMARDHAALRTECCLCRIFFSMHAGRPTPLS